YNQTEDQVDFSVGAGLEMDKFIEWACGNGLWGIENLSGVPGEAGASAVQNVGAYGTEAADIILNVHTYDSETNTWHTIGNKDCKFGYRDSVFKHYQRIGKHPLIIYAVDYRLSRLPKPNIEYPALKKFFSGCIPDNPHSVRKAIIDIRDSKLPSPEKVPSAGSFFKNPVISDEQLKHIAAIEGNNDFPHYAVEGGWKVPAAWLIEKCGWKGRKIGPVTVWHLQPLVLTNPHRRAEGKDVVIAEKMIIDSVREQYDITLEPEVEHI
ncbi:MAG: UDP-N-acetylmuramate dehydrogenase, partial [Duncaniella sp.]|nr:UDP-N-acetylmuramate dehydrogenase [Duncaniella sp.]